MLRYTFFCLVALAFWGCGTDGPEQNNFDRGALLANYRAQFIDPGLSELDDAITELQALALSFSQVPDTALLRQTQEKWLQTALAFERVNAFNFYAFGESGLRRGLVEELGTFPASPTKIEAFVSANDTSMANFDRDSRGLFALDYLLFRTDGNNLAVRDAFAQSANRCAYLRAVLAHATIYLDEVRNTWNNGDAATFVANDGTDVGSSTSMLYNEFVKSFEALKNFKLGIPLGLRPGQTQAEPEKVEAYYSGHSLLLLRAHAEALWAVWEGRGANGLNGQGLDDYLDAVVGGPELKQATIASWADFIASFNALPTNARAADLILNTPAGITSLHTEAQQHLRFFKSDLSSLLGISITYASGDGD